MSAEFATGAEIARRIASILGRAGLSLHQVSLRSEARYGRRSPHFIPHNLYQGLESDDFSPSLHHLVALSQISGYRLEDWCRVFGFRLDNIPRLQLHLPRERTVLLDSSLVDDNSCVAWFRDRPHRAQPSTIVPLSQWLEPSGAKRVRELRAPGPGFLYVRIGAQDALAFPDVLPGSVVRVVPATEHLPPQEPGRISDRLFLIEHGRGLWCSRLSFTKDGYIVPVSRQLPFAQVALRPEEEVRVLGVADLELRSLANFCQPGTPRALAMRWKPEPLPGVCANLDEQLRVARRRAALSFRGASAMSRKIAQLLGDERYYVAPGTLSDYETTTKPPRHVHKIITLCILYGLPFHTFLRYAGLWIEDDGGNPIPDDLASRGQVPTPASTLTQGDHAEGGFLAGLLRQWKEPPLVLRGALTTLSGMQKHSLHDFFWTGKQYVAPSPHLKGSLLLLINRQKKKPVHIPGEIPCRQPLYLIAVRDRGYTCASCDLENGMLVLHGYSCGFQRIRDQFLRRDDAEVVGQLVAVARRLE